MSYPLGTSVHTFLIDTDAHRSPVVLVIRYADGEVAMKECADYRAAQDYADRVTDDGAVVIAAVEGEADDAIGTASVWVRR